jgi:KaiC/GvpD/RAD55 family RecA-like ATPase
MDLHPCQFLSNPAAPHTLELVRFAIVLALRAAYGVPYSVESLQRLREAYGTLKLRFSDQQSRRQRRRASRYEGLILDLLSMDGRIHRSLTKETAHAYYTSFEQYVFGVSPTKRRDFGSPDGPQIDGILPDFSQLLNMAFSQPVGVVGLDEVTGGLMPTIPAPESQEWIGGLVTLIAGPPGSGKTSLCLSITSRMAELGSIVRYVSTEEESHTLEAKRTTVAEPSAELLWPDVAPLGQTLGNWMVMSGKDFKSLATLAEQIKSDLSHVSRLSSKPPEPHESGVYLVFPRVVVIDSMTALLQVSQKGTKASGRRELGRILNELRRMGICVFLVGALQDCDDEGLAYLVDNVFILDIDATTSARHPIRTITIRKTRLQSSSRGAHVFHLTARDGCSVGPSLHGVLRSLKVRPLIDSDPSNRAVLWSRDTGAPAQLALSFSDKSVSGAPTTWPSDGNGLLTLRARSQILIYGRGSSGKARLAMTIALEPRHPMNDDWGPYVVRHSERRLGDFERGFLRKARILVISFLYGKDYYEGIAKDVFRLRFSETGLNVEEHTTVLEFYPGYVDPETLVARVRRQIRSAHLEGRPFTAVVLDGAHNLLVQFPFLEREPLLWPTLYRLFRSEGIDTVTTFTFFKVALIDRTDAPTLAGSEHIFFQLLVSSCDYTLLAERPSDVQPRTGRNWVRVRLASTVDGFGKEPPDFWWDPATFTSRL